MADTFNLKGEALRKLLICAVDVSEQPVSTWNAANAIWEIQGYKTEDASIGLNPQKTKVTDILGDTYTDIEKFEAAISFEPNTLRMGAKLSELMVKYWRNGQLEKFSQFPALIGYGFIGVEGAFDADVYPQSTVTPNDLGGSSRVNMPFELDFGGERKPGTIDKMRGSDMVFTPTVNVA